MKHSKRFQEFKDKIEELYNIPDALKFLKDSSNTKFDETIEIAIKLGIDPKKEHVRGASSLPHGTGKTKRVLVFAEGAKAKEAEDAGADFIGSDDYLEKIKKGWLDFDAIVATPELMPKISKLGKILGPRGLMPNPKIGTLTDDVGKAVQDVKAGKVEFKMDKGGCLHSPMGKISFAENKLQENINQFLKSVWSAKPSSAKVKNFIETAHLSSTMGPGLKIDPKSIDEALKS